MVFNQFLDSSIIMLCIRTLIMLSQMRMLRIQHSPSDDIGGLSDASRQKINQFKSFGWILRFTETRDARIRVLTWDLLTQLFDYEFLQSHPSVIHQSINAYLKDRELYCVKISVLKFLNKVCDALIKNCEETGGPNDDLVDVNSQCAGLHGRSTEADSVKIEKITVKTLLQTLNRQGLISQIHKILSRKDCPLQFLTLSLKLLHNLTQMDYTKAIPVLTQLDYWTFLVELLDIEALMKIENHESKAILKDLKGQLPASGNLPPNGLINVVKPCENLDLIYMSLNSILDFLFEAFKRDS